MVSGAGKWEETIEPMIKISTQNLRIFLLGVMTLNLDFSQGFFSFVGG